MFPSFLNILSKQLQKVSLVFYIVQHSAQESEPLKRKTVFSSQANCKIHVKYRIILIIISMLEQNCLLIAYLRNKTLLPLMSCIDTSWLLVLIHSYIRHYCSSASSLGAMICKILFSELFICDIGKFFLPIHAVFICLLVNSLNLKCIAMHN